MEYKKDGERFIEKSSHDFEELKEIVAALRGEHGCTWDKAQTHETLKKCLTDECEEVLEAIDKQDDENLCEELGDVLLQVVLHSEIAKERGAFTLDDVIQGISEKMIRRHPHVFSNTVIHSPEEGRAMWQEIKRQEKARKK